MNCNTTHYRANSSSVPGDPTLRLLMNGLARIRHKNRIRVRIIGEGDFSQPLAGLIRSLGIEDLVEFDNRTYPADTIANRMSDCHVGIIPLEISSVTNYALPLKLMEYIAMGLPVISVRSAAINYYLEEQDCLFYQWDDPESLRSVIDGLVENPQRLQQYRQRSLAIRHRFLWTGEKQKYIQLLRTLADGTPAAPGGNAR